MANWQGSTIDAFAAGVLDVDPDRPALPQARQGYDATESSPRRKVPISNLRSEDAELFASKRQTLIATTRDLRRNFEVAAWAIRKHLDSVAAFNFQARTDDEDLNQEIERLMEEWGEPANCDVRGVHPWWRLVRIAEALATIDGDFAFVLLADGRLQGIEGDRIRSPGLGQMPVGSKATHGVLLDANGRPTGYAISRRGVTGAGGFVHERIVPAENVLCHGYYDRIDQVRGISPLSAALNRLRDTYESIEYQHARAKILSLFGLKFTRGASDAFPTSTQDGNVDQDGNPVADQSKVDWGQGNWVFDLEPGEDVAMLESQQPSSNWQSFVANCIQISLKALDIPMEVFDASRTNYSGARQAILQYQASSEEKRKNLRLMLDAVTKWRLAKFLAAGRLTLPGPMTLADLDWEWIATGNPGWIDPLKEVQAQGIAVDRLFQSTPAVVREVGGDAYQIAREQARYLAYCQRIGVQPLSATQPVPITEIERPTAPREEDE